VTSIYPHNGTRGFVPDPRRRSLRSNSLSFNDSVSRRAGGQRGAMGGLDMSASGQQSTNREIRVSRTVGRHLSVDHPTGNAWPRPPLPRQASFLQILLHRQTANFR